ncbi:MAG TPA: methylenetetrahydrofolate reductase C-terminal domain-containing protein [Candidatus Omnitrophota bacterium]|nr:methylenetetrahydrofolate reductase C-terminal domain-containing protein [Candidatus Omnitrophota bacterium]
MIVTKQKPSEEILKALEGKKNIFIVGCGDCATTCKTGGAQEVEKMADLLKMNGKEITGTAIPDVGCASAQAKIMAAKNREALKRTDAILVLACGSGVQTVKENDRFNIDVFPGCDSMFSALIQPDGSFKEVCSSCGECILAITEGICPVTRCSKGLLNGPCGGQDKGKCETDREKDCAWILIYNRLKDKGKISVLKAVNPPKNRNIKP